MCRDGAAGTEVFEMVYRERHSRADAVFRDGCLQFTCQNLRIRLRAQVHDQVAFGDGVLERERRRGTRVSSHHVRHGQVGVVPGRSQRHLEVGDLDVPLAQAVLDAAHKAQHPFVPVEGRSRNSRRTIQPAEQGLASRIVVVIDRQVGSPVVF
jgi:hypothetical protein